MLEFFKNEKLPEGPIQLRAAEKVINVAKFVGSHVAVLQSQPDPRIRSPYVERLSLLMSVVMCT